MAETPVTLEEWHKQRAVQRDTDQTGLELGFSTFFLNRTNRSGIIAGGVIGGLAQAGSWKIDARYNKTDLIRRIRKVGRYRSRITLSGVDAADMIRYWTTPAAEPALLYLDPPYFVKGEGLYDNFYSYRDHALIAQTVKHLTHPWVVSYDAAPEINELYAGIPAVEYSLSYSASVNPRGAETMYFVFQPRSQGTR